MSTAVKEIKAQGEREITDGFRRLQCHFGFESNFCNPASGHEKGSVETYVGYSRRNYFVPVPEISDLIEYNRSLLEKCDKDLNREHYKL
jgi:transposase